MGYIRHHAIVLTGYDRPHVEAARAEAERIGMAVSEIVESPTNRYLSVMVAPDGSKEGWEASALGDTQRDVFVEWLRSLNKDGVWIDWAELFYGDDGGSCQIVRYSGDED